MNRFTVASRVASRALARMNNNNHSSGAIIPVARSRLLVRLPRYGASSSIRYFSDADAPKTKAEESPADETEVVEKGATTETEETSPEDTAAVSREDELEQQVKDLKDQLLRSLAEQDNTRRIAQRDVESARQFAIKSFAKALLDTSDNLERALQAVPEDLKDDKENHAVLVTLFEGIEMTQSGLDKAFTMNGLVKFGEVGAEFDPNQHEALYEYPDPDKKPGTVGQIMKSGFMLNQRVLRPAEVGVVKKP